MKEHCEILYKARDNHKMVMSKIRQLEELASFPLLSSLDYSKDKVQSSHIRTLDDDVVKLLDLQMELKRSIGRYCDLRTTASKIIEQINEPERLILELRYCECLSYEEIAAQETYSLQHVYRLHNRGMKKVERLKYPPISKEESKCIEMLRNVKK